MSRPGILTNLLVLVNITTGGSGILSTPTNKVIVVGERLEMECRTSHGSIVREWDRERHSSKETDYLFRNWGTPQTHTRFPQFGAHVDDSGSGFLYSNSTVLEDAGIYTCVVEDESKLLRYSAYLILLESTPVCELNLTASENALLVNIWIQCRVHFRGGWSPLVEWKHHDGNLTRRGNGTVLRDGVRTTIINNSTIVSTLTFTVHSTKRVFSVSFKIYFTRPSGRTSVNSTNTPSYEHSWIERFGAELSDRLPLTGLNTWSEVARMTTPTFLSFAGSSSVPENGKYSLLLWLVATMATIIVVMTITVIMCFCRFGSNKAKNQLRVTSSSESHRNIESLQRGDHSPRAIGDHYDTIDEPNIVDESTAESPIIFLPQRIGLLPIPGYSGLQPVEQILSPSVYCRMNANDPTDKESESRKRSLLTHVGLHVPLREETEAYLVKGVLLKKDHENIQNKEGSDIYLTPIDDIEDTRSVIVNQSYLELFE